ncbi:peptidyl-prolyl cis-trans isomerase [Phakopsora pachyrhizi]|uniref:peptidylprolyl isomerase n=1 Tax=Phakopsora pachyrhizi TaxID=170000 RepID=A0AAV0APZ5_PHAPC|nr:peptidyl-prolyl cis-trans isomerase [Phakopsora pachyrhizi]
MLCTGEGGMSKFVPDRPLSYKGSVIHRIVPSFMIQGGDFISNNGKSGESIYGGEFDDENFDLNLDQEGLLVMANKGPNTNNSQWFITLAPAEHLNGKHVVFGRVQKGFEIIEEISRLETKKHRPVGDGDVVKIVHCGELELRSKKPEAESKKNEDTMGNSKSSKNRRASLSPCSTSSSRSSSHDSETSSIARRRHRRARKEAKKVKRQSSHRKTKRLKMKGDKTGPSQFEDQDNEQSRMKRAKEERVEAQRQVERQEEDARLEKERLRKQRALEVLKSKNNHGQNSGGIIFKGRGNMRYRDNDFGSRAWND